MYATISRLIVSTTEASLHLVFLTAALLLLASLLRARRGSRSAKPGAGAGRPARRPLPGPRTWPLLGSIPALVWYTRRHGHRAFTEMARRHGPVFALRLGPGQLLVVLNDRRSIREAFVHQSAKMNNRHIQGLVKVSFPVQGSLAWENGEIWAARRKFILRAFRTLGFSKSGILGQRIQEEAAALCRSIDARGGSPFNPRRLLEFATSNLFCAIALGSRYEYESPALRSLVRNSRIVLDNLSAVSLGNCLPFLYNTRVCREYRGAVGGLTGFIRGLVEQHRATRSDADAPRDVVDLYLAEVGRRRRQGPGEAGKGPKFQEEDVWRSMLDILIAGSFSTASHVLWTLLFMTQYRDVQQRIHDEIDAAVGRERAPSLDDSPRLPYTRATLFEVHRCRISTVSVPHLASEDAAVGGCRVPEGAQVLANFWAVHHDPLEWERPERFEPDRFLSEDGSTVVAKDNFMPFGVGPRICPGEQFAKHQSLLIFATIMHRYRLTIPPTDPTPDLEGTACGPALHPGDFRICAQIRWLQATDTQKAAMELLSFALLTVTSFVGWCALYRTLCFLQPHRSKEWNSRLVVIVHAVTILIMAAVFGFFFNPWPFTHPGGRSNSYEISTMVVCNGYFVYDFLRSMLCDTKRNTAMIVHHVVCIMFTSASLVSGLSGTEIGFALFLAELTNPMLQVRWLMRNAGVTGGILYELNQVLFLVAFALIRVGIGSYWIYHYLLHPLPHPFFKLGGLLLYAVSIIFMAQILLVVYRKFSRSDRREGTENLPVLDKTKI